MPRKIERHIDELYGNDPERADAVVFGRRGFLTGAGLAAMGGVVGAAIPFSADMPSGFVPAAMAQDKPAPAGTEAAGPKMLEFPGKDPGLVVLGDKPLVAETPERLLDDATTPTEKFFIRNNGQLPEKTADPNAWSLTIDGEVNTPLKLTVGELKSRFQPVSLHMVLECGGNGRSFFTPPARGNQWTNGGAGCAQWTGVRLKDVLQAAGVKPGAVYTANYGADVHLSGDTARETLSRGVPIAKAMDEHSLLVWDMNGKPLEAIHGAPLRLVIPGYPGSVSHKWLNRIWIRDKIHDGQGMGGQSYRLAIKPMIPGDKPAEGNFKILESMPTRSIITSPTNGEKLPSGTREIALRGATWNGESSVKEVHVSIDFGASWKKAELAPPRNKYDWARWTAKVSVPSEGYYELWSRATDDKGVMQPHVAGGWNPQGYGSNPMHRIAVLVEA